jgi:hypothetical protein
VAKILDKDRATWRERAIATEAKFTAAETVSIGQKMTKRRERAVAGRPVAALRTEGAQVVSSLALGAPNQPSLARALGAPNQPMRTDS